MSLSFDRALGLHEQALAFRAERAAVLANNIANADTPNYKARDLDFASVLEAQQSGANSTVSLQRTHANHIPAQSLIDKPPGLRIPPPHQPSIDGNTVEAQPDQARYPENAINFQPTSTFP